MLVIGRFVVRSLNPGGEIGVHFVSFGCEVLEHVVIFSDFKGGEVLVKYFFF